MSSKQELSATPSALLCAIDQYDSHLAADLDGVEFFHRTADSFDQVRLGAAVLLGLLGYAGNGAVRALEHRVLRWQHPR